MSALDHLRAVGGGAVPADDGLLGNARCAWGRGELIGQEGILAGFCAKPFACNVEALAIETPQGAALIGDNDAIIADIYNGRLGRLWRVGPDIAAPVEQAVDVAFDADLRHERGGVCFRAEDHPELPSHLVDKVVKATEAHVDSVRRAGSLRARAFVVRAFAAGESIAVLLSVYALGNEASRSASFSYAMIGIGDQGEPRIVCDRPAPREWTPRL